MIPSRRTQPYRAGARQPGQTLSAMLAGRPLFLPNPQDIQRQTMRRRAPSLLDILTQLGRLR